MKKDPTRNAQQLGNLLERYKKHLRPPQASVEKECVEVVREVCGFNLNPSQVSYTTHTRTLHIKTPSVLRSELVQHHSIILKELTQRLGVKNAPKQIV